MCIQQKVVLLQVYFDISIGGKPAGRIVIGVFGEIVPKTAKNFVELAKGTEVRLFRNPVFHNLKDM